MDNLTKKQRSNNMKCIKSKDTEIEVKLRRELWKRGYRYRKNDRSLPGTPDITMPQYMIAIFCDGEFFHGKNWDDLRMRLLNSNNADYWISKISHNIERDNQVNRMLLNRGWTVIRFWGNEIKSDTEGCIRIIDDTVIELKAIKYEYDA